MSLTDRILRALQFNCEYCDVPVGSFCISLKGKPMSRYVHVGRVPWEDNQFTELRLEDWLRTNGRILVNAADG